MTKSDLSPARLERLHDVLAGHVAGGAVPGLVWGILRRGDTHLEAIGTMEPGRGRPVERDTIFRISSMTKPVTAVAALLLVEECVLRLDDSVVDLLPELAGQRVLARIDGPPHDTVPIERPITLRDLLTFRMGFGGYFGPCPTLELAESLELGIGPPQPALPPEPAEWMRRFASLPLLVQPGTRWLYHTGADLLGVLIARAAGTSFEEFLAQRVFAPLGMKDTGFFVSEDQLGRFGTCYATDPADGSLSVFDPPDGQWSKRPAFPGGGAGLVSTTADFLAFGEMLLRGGAPLLSRPTVATMTSDHLTPAQKAVGGFFPDDFDARGWGFCVGVVTRRDSPSAPAGQYGWDGGLGTVWRNDPSEDMALVLLTNAMWTSPRPPAVVQDFLTAAYAAVADY